MTPPGQNVELETWVDRTRRMVGYRDEALDFLRRASQQVPVLESDVGLVCNLWALADEYDELICRALTEFDTALFESPGELDITRGVETRPTPEDESNVVFLCTWAVVRPDRESVSCILYGKQFAADVGMEVRDSRGVGHPISFPIINPSDLYEKLSDSFFVLASRQSAGPKSGGVR